MREFATKVNYKQPGDPEKLAQAFLKLAALENPPVHLPLGNDTCYVSVKKQQPLKRIFWTGMMSLPEQIMMML